MIKLFIVFALMSLSTSLFPQKTNSESIKWPKEYEPSRSKFYVHNEIEINARPETVWKYLIDALQWEPWYEGAKNVSFNNTEDTFLTASTVFKWKTMGLRFESTIMQFETNKLLAWESKKKSIRGYHVWLLIPDNNGGCKVITDESQNGWLTFFEKTFQRNKLKKLHDVWLSELKKKSENN